jgi:hypothetical protein
MDRMHGAWHNHVIDCHIEWFDDRGIRQGKEFGSEALFPYVAGCPQFIL